MCALDQQGWWVEDVRRSSKPQKWINLPIIAPAGWNFVHFIAHGAGWIEFHTEKCFHTITIIRHEANVQTLVLTEVSAERFVWNVRNATQNLFFTADDVHVVDSSLNNITFTHKLYKRHNIYYGS